MVAVYGARSTNQNQAMVDHIKRLERELPARTVWKYQIDTGRTQFDDAIGDFFTIWRSARPVQLPPRQRDQK